MPPRQRKLSPPAIEILRAMLIDASAEYYGLELSNEAGVLTGTVYPLLRRLEERGWLQSRLEDVDPTDEGRPPRILYRLTPSGIENARLEVRRSQGLSTSRRLAPGTS